MTTAKPILHRVLGLFLLLAVLAGCGRSSFYMARSYTDPEHLRLLEDPAITRIVYHLQDDMQTAFYVGGLHPQRVWLLFGGINSLALDWYQWFGPLSNEQTSLLLIDYPGYGLNPGTTRAKGMFAAGRAAFAALRHHLRLSEESWRSLEVNVLGHSIGTGVALSFALYRPVKNLMLVAPFTTLDELIIHRYGRLVGSVLNSIIPEDYPNEAMLAAIAGGQHPPRIIIVHGEQDITIPSAMGRRLARMFPTITDYHELPRMGHRNMFRDNLDLFLQLMQEDEAAAERPLTAGEPLVER